MGMCIPNYLSVIPGAHVGSVTGTRNVLILHLHWFWRWLISYVIHLYFLHSYLGRTVHWDTADKFIPSYKTCVTWNYQHFQLNTWCRKYKSVCHWFVPLPKGVLLSLTSSFSDFTGTAAGYLTHYKQRKLCQQNFVTETKPLKDLVSLIQSFKRASFSSRLQAFPFVIYNFKGSIKCLLYEERHLLSFWYFSLNYFIPCCDYSL